jgi:hypothetical protein
MVLMSLKSINHVIVSRLITIAFKIQVVIFRFILRDSSVQMSNQANLAEEMTARAPSGDYSKIAWETLSSLDRLCQGRTFIMLIYYMYLCHFSLSPCFHSRSCVLEHLWTSDGDAT